MFSALPRENSSTKRGTPGKRTTPEARDYSKGWMRTRTWTDLEGALIAERYRLRTLVYAGRRQAEFLAVEAAAGEAGVPLSVSLFAGGPQEIDQELSRIAQAKQLQHPHVLAILDGGSCSLDGDSLLYVVTRAPEGTLAQRLANGPLAPVEVRGLLEDLLAALSYIHAQGLVYRSLALDTIVLIERRWKLGDLGDLHATGSFPSGAPPQASRYVPPEAASGAILPAWDIWTLGFILRDALGDPGEPAVVPAPFDAILRGCMDPDPATRLTLAGIGDLLRPHANPAPKILPPPLPAPRPPEAPAKKAIPSMALAGLAVLALSGLLWLIASRPPKSPPVPISARRTLPVALPNTEGAMHAGRPSPFSGKALESRPYPTALPAAAHPADLPTTTTAAAISKPLDSSAPPRKPPVETVSESGGSYEGLADFLSDQMDGHPTASGELFSSTSMSGAHRNLPLGTRVKVTNLENQRSAIVRINDRGAFRRGIVISVTRSVAAQLGFVSAGSARVRVEVLP